MPKSPKRLSPPSRRAPLPPGSKPSKPAKRSVSRKRSAPAKRSVSRKRSTPKTQKICASLKNMSMSDIEICNKLVKPDNDDLNNLLDYMLIRAAEDGHFNIVKELLALGVESNTRVYPNAYLSSAAEYGHMNIVKFMLEYGANDFNTSMINAAKNGHLDIVQEMVARGANDFNTAMIAAAGNGHLDVVQEMIARGARKYDEALYVAIKDGGYMDVIRELLMRGADADQINKFNAAYKPVKDQMRVIQAQVAYEKANQSIFERIKNFLLY